MRKFSKLNLSSLCKYGEIKYDFKHLKENLPYVLNNCANRAANCSPIKVVEMWEQYKRQLFDMDKLRKMKNAHAEE